MVPSTGTEDLTVTGCAGEDAEPREAAVAAVLRGDPMRPGVFVGDLARGGRGLAARDQPDARACRDRLTAVKGRTDPDGIVGPVKPGATTLVYITLPPTFTLDPEAVSDVDVEPRRNDDSDDRAGRGSDVRADRRLERGREPAPATPAPRTTPGR